MHEVRGTYVPTVKGEVAASAATANLLVYIHDLHRYHWIVERAETLAQRLPARLLLLNATSPPHSAELAPVPLNVHRCELRIGDLTPETILALVRPTLGRALPTCLWWCASDESQDTLLLSLAELAKHLVVDSSSALHDAGAVADLAHVYARMPQLSLRDLAWMRIAPWRDAVAHLFDDPTATAELPRIIRVEITAGGESEALYLVGWLASRLGWSAVGDRRFLDRQGKPVNIFLIDDETDQPNISAIRLRTASAEFVARMAEHSEAIVGTYRTNGSNVTQLVIPFQPTDSSHLIERALLRPGTDELFEAALRIIRDLGSLHD